jgi:hypothetical protein
MLQQQQPQRDLGWRLRPAARAAVLMTLTLCIINAVNQLLVIEQLVGFHHPRLPQSPNVPGHHAFPQSSLRLFAAGHPHDRSNPKQGQ